MLRSILELSNIEILYPGRISIKASFREIHQEVFMICNNCGQELPDGLTFCPKCGTKLTSDSITKPTSDQKHETKHQGKPNPLSMLDNEEKSKEFIKSKIGFIAFTIEIIAICIIYLSVSNHLKSNSLLNFESTRRILTVFIINDDDETEENDVSDITQISNALQNGGGVHINIGNMDSDFKETISSYAAYDADGRYYVLGAVLNYIASKGWELVQGPSTGLSSIYYFIK